MLAQIALFTGCLLCCVVCVSRRQLDDALVVYTSAASLSRDQREIEHIALYEKGELVYYSYTVCVLRKYCDIV